MATVSRRYYNPVRLALPPGAGLAFEPFTVERGVAIPACRPNTATVLVGVRCPTYERACPTCWHRHNRERLRPTPDRQALLRDAGGRVSADGHLDLRCWFLCGERCLRRRGELGPLRVTFYVLALDGWYAGETAVRPKPCAPRREPLRIPLHRIAGLHSNRGIGAPS